MCSSQSHLKLVINSGNDLEQMGHPAITWTKIMTSYFNAKIS